MLEVDDKGIYCAAGNFYIDPWKPVKLALITHGHSDHAKAGHSQYISTQETAPILQYRLGKANPISIATYNYDETFSINGVTLSFHPAGHILGSAQIRVEHQGEVWVVSGDYKRASDPSCADFQVIDCDTFISECTFGLPIYRWQPGEIIVKQIYEWWQRNASRNQPSVLLGYALGKTQRILAELTKFTDQPIYIHGALDPMISIYRDADILMLETISATDQEKGKDFSQELILAPPSAFRSSWMRRFKNHTSAFASGWMRVRGNRRNRGYEKGFVLSDHADWPALLASIQETNANQVYLTYGRAPVLERYLNEEMGISAQQLETGYVMEEGP